MSHGSASVRLFARTPRGSRASVEAGSRDGLSRASSTYFAAIPGSSGFNTVNDCGACVEITNGGTSIVATIIDECPTDNGQNPACQQASHLSYGTWQLPNGANAAGATVTLTDVEGHAVTVTIPGGGGSTGQQFPDRCP